MEYQKMIDLFENQATKIYQIKQLSLRQKNGLE